MHAYECLTPLTGGVFFSLVERGGIKSILIKLIYKIHCVRGGKWLSFGHDETAVL